VVIIRNGLGFAFEEVAVGDIIVFHAENGGGKTIVHRVVKIYSDIQTGEGWSRQEATIIPSHIKGLTIQSRERTTMERWFQLYARLKC
jgi:hypothetical protein